ncbi:MAG: DUF6079 family protein [Pyrinomonadaceae bacterium]
MKRIQEKVKDLVEVLGYKSLQDFISDPAQTLSIYHFTDQTADLMAKWLDRLASVQAGNGAANALAGYRGVGKSHFLATLGAVASHPELRSRISDPHVATIAQRLKRARYAVAFVRRGTHDTLYEELKDAIAKTFETEAKDLSDSLPELLEFATGRAGDLPLVLIIDTAFERASRVARDDGVLLGEIAEEAKKSNIFVAVALDDDIAGADGVNAAIARRFSIDYLDQEHLYRIVDQHIFPKHRQKTPLLHEIYQDFKEAMPNFRWSEQRFASLYPLHPVILENAPFVRLYAPEFALLGFASEAGNKILGRPANSLIALDEVFDSVEMSLRKIEDLNEAFATYDRISADVITQMPVMQRHQGKLVLKGLFLLSLEGEGTTAGEIGAAMLIYDEADPPKAVAEVEELLKTFVAACPDDIQQTAVGDDVRYSLKVSGKDNLNLALNEAVKSVSPDVVPKILRRVARERFPDWDLTEENSAPSDAVDLQIVWRGGLRQGRVVWNLEGGADKNAASASDILDWEVIVNPSSGKPEKSKNDGKVSRVFWQTAELRESEIEIVSRYYLLLTDQTLLEEYGEQIRAAGHSNLIAVEKIWNRVFLEEATVWIDGFDYNFSELARNAATLREVFSDMLDPLFETLYPEHPRFAEPLEMAFVSKLVNDFFSGARQTLAENQRLAEIFALPLGLVVERGNYFVVESGENISRLPYIEKILALVKDSEKAVSLKAIYEQLRQPPYGLEREAAHLILTALVANRQIEFVTSRGDRINRRSLDLKIIWDDIEAVAKPSSVLYGDERLTEWAKILTTAEDFKSISSPEDREAIQRALTKWQADWQASSVLERFNDLPDEILNTKIWRLAMHAQKTFGAVATNVSQVLDGAISLEEGFYRTADAFSDSEKEFFARRKDLIVLEDFINGAAKRHKIWHYLAVCQTTQDAKIEHLRERLVSNIEESRVNPSQTLNDETEDLWQTFHAKFTEYFAVKHDLVMKSLLLQEKLDLILRGDEWWEFENLSRLTIFQKNYWREAQKIRRQIKELNCRYDVREMLQIQPFCACSFDLGKTAEWENLPETLYEHINFGRKNYRKVLQTLSQTLSPLIEKFAEETDDEEFFDAANRLIEVFKENKHSSPFSHQELVILQKIFDELPTSPLMQIKLPTEEGFLSHDELRVRVNNWLEELPHEPVLLKI